MNAENEGAGAPHGPVAGAAESDRELVGPTISGKVLAPVFGLVLFGMATFALVMFWLRKDPYGPILAVAPVDEHRAMVLRRGYEERGYIHLVLLDIESGTQAWSEALFGVQPRAVLVVDGDEVFVRAREARGHAELHAFSVEDGEFRWRGEPPADEPPEGFPVAEAFPLIVGEDVVYDLHGSDSLRILEFGRADGETRAQLSLELAAAPVFTRLAEGDHLEIALADGSGVVVDPVGVATPVATLPGGPRVPAQVRRQGDAIVSGGGADQRWVRLVAADDEPGLGEPVLREGLVWVPRGADLLVFTHPELELRYGPRDAIAEVGSGPLP